MDLQFPWSQTIAGKSTPHLGIGRCSILKHFAVEEECYEREHSESTHGNTRKTQLNCRAMMQDSESDRCSHNGQLSYLKTACRTVIFAPLEVDSLAAGEAVRPHEGQDKPRIQQNCQP